MPLKIYNVLTRKKEEFKPLLPGKLRMYVCGITPYDECHLGHARAAVVFDVIYRYLRHKFPNHQVVYVRNYTDVDDKIIKRANDIGQTYKEISEKYITSYKQQMEKLGVAIPTVEPKATEHIDDMKRMIQDLVHRGFAYPSGHDVFYRVRKFSGYGKLSHKKLDELESGARIEVDEKKEDPLDFALWKSAKPGEPSWESPWGLGRPGWHIECSTMSRKYLCEPFGVDSIDIHGGGRDLMFPHHENEIAQSEGATGKKPFARFWIHNGFVNINAEKMSKSLGNFRSVPQILQQWDPEVVRYFLLSAHYASPLDFTHEALLNAKEALSRFYETMHRLSTAPTGSGHLSVDFNSILEHAMSDDFNTTAVIGEIFRVLRQINQTLDARGGWDPADKSSLLNGFQSVIGSVLGIFHSDPAQFIDRQKNLGLQSATVTEDDIKKLIEERKSARLSKNFHRSDEIRQELSAKGVILKDNPDGTTTWEIKPV